jgi:hypothetical protein
MSERYDRGLMKRGAEARRLIAEGEDPVRMLLAVVWPDHEWAESAVFARLAPCPTCSDDAGGCAECGSTGLVTAERRELLMAEALADYAYNAA